MSRINPIKKQFWITRNLDEKLERDADSCCLSQAEYVRLVLSGITPRAAPPKEFFQLTELKHLRERLEQTFLGRGDTENGCE